MFWDRGKELFSVLYIFSNESVFKEKIKVGDTVQLTLKLINTIRLWFSFVFSSWINIEFEKFIITINVFYFNHLSWYILNVYCFVFSSCQADHLFTVYRAENDPERAKLLMSKHVQAAHNIYSETVFSINGKSKKGI